MCACAVPGADSSTTDNHATSGLKFEILYELLSLGVSVLLTDIDVPIFQDPFLILVRDSDVENMSDGCAAHLVASPSRSE